MTARDLTTAMATAVQAGVVRPALLYEGEFVSPGTETATFLRLWSGYGDLSWDGKTWTGAGHLLGLSPLGENSELRAEGFTVSLSGMSSEDVSRALQEVRSGKPGKLWLGLLKADAYLSLPGVSGNYSTTPDSAAFTFAGDIDFRFRAALVDWTPSAQQTLIAKFGFEGNQSFILRVNTTGVLVLTWTADGSADRNATSTAAVSAADGAIKWVRVTLDVDNGAGGCSARFYTSDDYDPASGTGTWTQLGSTVTAAGVSSVFDSTAVVELGARTGGTTNPLNGAIYYAEIRNGIDGTVVARFDPTRFKASESTAVMATGETWTINTSGGTPARIVSAGEVLIADPYLIGSGKFDTASFEDAGNAPLIISAAYEGELIDLDRSRERRWTPEDQALDYDGDKGFDQVAQLQDAVFTWGR